VVLTWSGRIRISAASWARIFCMSQITSRWESERVCHKLTSQKASSA